MLVRIAVGAALVGAAAVHLLLASTYGQASAVVGAAFILGGVTAVIAGAWLMISDADLAWDFAAAVSAGMLLALALSASIGLFGVRTTEVGVAEGVAILTEVSVLVAWAATRLRRD